MGFKRSSKCLADDTSILWRQVTPQQQRRADNIRCADLRDDERNVGLGVLQNSGRETTEYQKRLDDAVEGGQEHDAGEKERNLTRPSRSIQRRVPVLGEQSEDIVDRIAVRKRRGRGRESMEGRQSRGADTVEAVNGKAVGEEVQEASDWCFRAKLRLSTVLQCEHGS